MLLLDVLFTYLISLHKLNALNTANIVYYYSHISGDEEYTAAWKLPDNFTEIIVSPDMLAHHFPDALLDAIDEIREKNIPVQPITQTTTGNKLDTRIIVE